MLTDVSQRWRERKTFFVDGSRLFNPRGFEVAEISESEAKDYILRTHYSGTYPAARRRFGLFLGGTLIGCADLSHPMADCVLTKYFGGSARESLELGRFVIDDHDRAGFNCESWFFARCRETLKREDYRGIISFCDDLKRTDSAGKTVFTGHIGVSYCAQNAVYTGRAAKSLIYLLPDGRAISRRTISKIRNNETGAEYAAAQLIAHGADSFPSDPAERRRWLETWLPRITRSTPHPGNHRYLFAL